MGTNLKIIHMFTDKSMHTRFQEKYLELTKKEGLGSVGFFSDLFAYEGLKDNLPALKMQFALTPAPDNPGEEGPALSHAAPRKQLVITLDGYLEFKSCDVDTEDSEHVAIIKPGDVLLAEDLEGAGHMWRFLPDENGKMHPWVRCYIHLGDKYDHFISRLIK